MKLYTFSELENTHVMHKAKKEIFNHYRDKHIFNSLYFDDFQLELKSYIEQTGIKLDFKIINGTLPRIIINKNNINLDSINLFIRTQEKLIKNLNSKQFYNIVNDLSISQSYQNFHIYNALKNILDSKEYVIGVDDLAIIDRIISISFSSFLNDMYYITIKEILDNNIFYYDERFFTIDGAIID